MIKVLSLFDGISCAQIALNGLGIREYIYYASEIDKFAIQVTQSNYPKTIQLGSVTEYEKWRLEEIDLLIGGFPCQSFSFAGNQLAFTDSRGELFFYLLKILRKIKPKYFLFENVNMKQGYQSAISNLLGVCPIEINSSLLTAQNRRRLYWTNIPNISLPQDKKIFLKDILESGEVDRDKSYCVDANYFKGGSLKNYIEKFRRQIVFEPTTFNYSSSGRGNRRVEDRTSEASKSGTLTKTGYTNRSFTGVIGEGYSIRKLTPIECERLQGVPENYTSVVSNSQRYKCLGNGFTVPVIEHILSFSELSSLGNNSELLF